MLCTKENLSVLHARDLHEVITSTIVQTSSDIPLEGSAFCNDRTHETSHLIRRHLTLISTWLKVLPLYTPTMDPTISGRMTMSLRWVFTTSGFSMGGASFFALRRRFRRDCCLRRRPRFSLLLWRAQYSCISCSLNTHTERERTMTSMTVFEIICNTQNKSTARRQQFCEFSHLLRNHVCPV